MLRTTNGFRIHRAPGFRLGVAVVPYWLPKRYPKAPGDLEKWPQRMGVPRDGTDLMLWFGPVIVSWHTRKKARA